jgi:hypothetical protein
MKMDNDKTIADIWNQRIIDEFKQWEVEDEANQD